MADPPEDLPADPVRLVEAEVRKVLPDVVQEDPDSDPPLLHHYTSGHGLLGILDSGDVHCTNVLFMNDASEMDYGRALARQVVDDSREKVPPLLAPYLARISRMLEMPDFQYFVSCFCEKADLLSQWRAYGMQSGGYSIGFAAADLREALPEYSELVRVIYDPAVQREALRRALARYLSTAETCCAHYAAHQRLEDALTRWANAAANGLGRLVARMKSQAFEEEHEWRVIIIRFSFDTGHVQFRVAPNGIVVPYLPWRFRKEGVKAVRQVRHSPAVNPTLALASLGVLLTNLGYRDVKIVGSAIPLRT